MGKGQRVKDEKEEKQVQQEHLAYSDFVSNLGLCAAAKSLSDDELSKIFAGQRERLKLFGYSDEVISKVLENVANGLTLLKGEKPDDSSRKTENIRPN